MSADEQHGRDEGASGEAGGAAADRVCPVCGERASLEAETHPFCSKRCRMADLGRWFSGEYLISREITEDDLKNES